MRWTFDLAEEFPLARDGPLLGYIYKGYQSWLRVYTESGGCPSKGVGYFSQLELERERERERVIIQENKQAAPYQVISTYTLFPLIILLVTPVQHM